MDRRTFIGGVAGGLLVVPLVARAQQPAMPVVGFLNSRAAGDDPPLLAAFRQGLKEVGYVDGQNVAIEYRFAEGQDNRLPALAADLVRRQVAVIAANGLAAQTAKTSIVILPFASHGGSAVDDQAAGDATLSLTEAIGKQMPFAWVISPGLASTYRGKPNDPRAVGRELNVRYVVEAELRRVGDQVAARRAVPAKMLCEHVARPV